MGLLPLGESPSQHAHLLRHRRLLLGLAIALALLAAGLYASFAAVTIGCGNGRSSMLSLASADILQSGAGPSLFGKGAMKNDGLGILELPKQGGQLGIELMGRNPFGTFDVATNVI